MPPTPHNELGFPRSPALFHMHSPSTSAQILSQSNRVNTRKSFPKFTTAFAPWNTVKVPQPSPLIRPRGACLGRRLLAHVSPPDPDVRFVQIWSAPTE